MLHEHSCDCHTTPPCFVLINESTVEPAGDSLMKVLIAGATGVLGRRLVQQLRDRDHNAIAIA